jgi:anthranilate phosphoribosyltransferase
VVGLSPATLTLEETGGWPAILGKLTARTDLTAAEASAAFDEILAGDASPVQIAAFVAALRTKGETVEEMAALVAAMRARAERVQIVGSSDVVDTCGTGGDRSGSINVSTIAALVVAGGGTRVCKHGGRAASSMAGSADVLEALGVAIDLGPAGVERCVAETGIGFCFAPRFHSAMRHAVPVRRELRIATVFNFLGPLANPAFVRRQVVGVGDPAMAERMIGVLEANGALHAMVVYGHDGLDELSTAAPSTIIETVAPTAGGFERREFVVDPSDLGIALSGPGDLAGGDASTNASAARRVLAGDPGPHRDVVVLNAAAGFVVADRVPDLRAGIDLAQATIDSGAAGAALAHFIEVSQSAAAAGL